MHCALVLRSFATRVFTSTVADVRDTCGAVTNVPQYATRSGFVFSSHVCRVIPEPEYHRQFVCRELSTFTATTFSALNFRYGVSSYANGTNP